MMHEDDRHRVWRQGTEAWKRLKKNKQWRDWIVVGEALIDGRAWAMNQAQTNRPEGKAYNMAFGEWLQERKLDDMDKGDRSRLFTVMDNIGMIEDWRRTLTQTQRLALNHPNAVLRKWKRAIEPEDPTKEPKPTLRDSVANLSEDNDAKSSEIEQLKARIAELEEELATARDTIAELRSLPLADEQVKTSIQKQLATTVREIEEKRQATKRKPKIARGTSNDLPHFDAKANMVRLSSRTLRRTKEDLDKVIAERDQDDEPSQ